MSSARTAPSKGQWRPEPWLMMVSIICISAGVPARDWQYCDSNLIQILLTTFTVRTHQTSPAWPGRGSLQFTTWWVVDRLALNPLLEPGVCIGQRSERRTIICCDDLPPLWYRSSGVIGNLLSPLIQFRTQRRFYWVTIHFNGDRLQPSHLLGHTALLPVRRAERDFTSWRIWKFSR